MCSASSQDERDRRREEVVWVRGHGRLRRRYGNAGISLLVIAFIVSGVSSPARALMPLDAEPAGCALGFGDRYDSQGRGMVHHGVDLVAAPGAAVRAAAGGTVVFVGEVPASDSTSAPVMTAMTVELCDGRHLTLMPLDTVCVGEGDHVMPGQQLARLAVEGDVSTDETHLHVGLRSGDRYEDPATLLGVREPVDACGEAEFTPNQPVGEEALQGDPAPASPEPGSRVQDEAGTPDPAPSSDAVMMSGSGELDAPGPAIGQEDDPVCDESGMRVQGGVTSGFAGIPSDERTPGEKPRDSFREMAVHELRSWSESVDLAGFIGDISDVPYVVSAFGIILCSMFMVWHFRNGHGGQVGGARVSAMRADAVRNVLPQAGSARCRLPAQLPTGEGESAADVLMEMAGYRSIAMQDVLDRQKKHGHGSSRCHRVR